MRAHFRTFVVVVLAVVLFAWFLRGADLAGVWSELRRGRLELLLLSLVTTMMTYAFRAYRWQFLLAGLGPTRFSDAFRTTVIGFAASFLLPARAGEFLRPYLLAQRSGLSATAAFATVVLERVFDMAAILILFAVFLVAADPALAQASPVVYRTVQAGGLSAAVATAAMLLVFFVMAGHPEKIGRISARIEQRLPARLARLVAGLAERFATGLGAVRRPQQLLLVFVWSFPLWMSIGLGIYLVSKAFHIEVSYVDSFVIVTLLAVGVTVPTPGSVGGFHKFYQIAVMSFFHASTERAVGAGIVLHAVSFVPVTLLGIAFMAQEGLTLGGMRRMASEAGSAEEGAR